LHENGNITVGPDSVGYRLVTEARVFGGSTLTATDIAVAAGLANIGDRRRVSDLAPDFVQAALRRMKDMLEEAIDRVKTDATPVPVVLVGGGVILVDSGLAGATEVLRPEHAGCANAVGAAIAQVSGEFDSILQFTDANRDKVLESARAQAVARAIAAGAAPGSIQIYNIEETPMAYMPGGGVQVRVKAVGDLNLGSVQ